MASKSSVIALQIMGPMEFADVVRRRKMVRNYTDDPVDPAVVDRALANAVRAPSAGFSQGWGFLVLDTPDDVRRYWAATADDLDDPDEWLSGMMRAPVVIVPCSSKAAYLGRYAEPDKGWTDRGRGPLAGAVLAHGRRDGLAADPADGGRRGARAPASSGSRRTRCRRLARSSRSLTRSTRSAPSPSATRRRPPGAKGSPSRRRRKDLDEVVHRGSVERPADMDPVHPIRERCATAAPFGLSRIRDTEGLLCVGTATRGTASRRRGDYRREKDMIVLGLILLIIGLVASISILTTIGVILLVVGLILNLVPIGGTRRRVF